MTPSNLGISTRPRDGGYVGNAAINNNRRGGAPKDMSHTIVIENDTFDTESLSCSLETGSGVSSLTLPSVSFTADKDCVHKTLHRATLNISLENSNGRGQGTDRPHPSLQNEARETSMSAYEMGIILSTENARINARHAPRKQISGNNKSEDIVSQILQANKSTARHYSYFRERPSLGESLKILNREHVHCQQETHYLKGEVSRSNEMNLNQGDYRRDVNDGALISGSFEYVDDLSSATSGYLSSDDSSIFCLDSAELDDNGDEEYAHVEVGHVAAAPTRDLLSCSRAEDTCNFTSASIETHFFPLFELSSSSDDESTGTSARSLNSLKALHAKEKQGQSRLPFWRRQKWRFFRRKKTANSVPMNDDEIYLLCETH